jgi:hypothetical protein
MIGIELVENRGSAQFRTGVSRQTPTAGGPRNGIFVTWGPAKSKQFGHGARAISNVTTC